MSSARSRRIRLRLEFDGRGFCGWQQQSLDREGVGTHLTSIQSELERAVSTVLRRPGERTVVQGCSRTDAGVSAEEFFCHFDVPTEAQLGSSADDYEKLRHALNCVLPEGIVVLDLDEAPKSWHALESATAKVYEYCVLLRRAKPTLQKGRTYWMSVNPLNAEYFDKSLLEAALAKIVGRHDFKAFMAAHSGVKTTVRTVHSAVARYESLGSKPSSGQLLVIEFRGEGFLKHMVRNLVGTCLEIATHRRELSTMEALLRPEASRTTAGLCAPAEALCLKRVEYAS